MIFILWSYAEVRLVSKIRYCVHMRIIGEKQCYDAATDKSKLGVSNDATPESSRLGWNQATARTVQEIESNASDTEGKKNLYVSLLSRFIVQPTTSSPGHPLMRPTSWYERRLALKIRLNHFRSLGPTLTRSCWDGRSTKIVLGLNKESNPCERLLAAPRSPWMASCKRQAGGPKIRPRASISAAG